ncbi:MAG: type II toxin-antitoxin system mRNA interferase toxin, RelE/StbE family [Candidatus Niyogibacteria bacterium]|nr:type II toxin-antitoxin system mRNA interferase toxin, RelE/StbE family [Candidatus Niyogibacteria bacterium]
MKIVYSRKFARDYRSLPLRIQAMTERRETIFIKNPFDRRLKTHKLSGRLKGCWSFSIDQKYRIIFEFVSENIIWFHAVGNHSVYQ